MVRKRHEKNNYIRSSEQNQKVSATLQRQYASGQRTPTVNAMLAVGWSIERKEKQKATSQLHFAEDHWSKTDNGRKLISLVHSGKTITPEHRKRVSEAAQKRLKLENQYSRCKKGKRADLDSIFFRSSWEANYARILNHLGVSWEYEPETFQIGDTETYTPDFKLGDGTLIEIKGWWTEAGKRKINLFQAHYPDARLQIIERKEYIALTKQFRSKIKNWE